MNRSTRIFTTILLLSMVALLPRVAHANVDSFFDIFYEVSFDPASGGPIVVARGVIREPEFQSRTVQTEILSMSLSSHAPSRIPPDMSSRWSSWRRTLDRRTRTASAVMPNWMWFTEVETASDVPFGVRSRSHRTNSTGM